MLKEILQVNMIQYFGNIVVNKFSFKSHASLLLYNKMGCFVVFLLMCSKKTKPKKQKTKKLKKHKVMQNIWYDNLLFTSCYVMARRFV